MVDCLIKAIGGLNPTQQHGPKQSSQRQGEKQEFSYTGATVLKNWVSASSSMLNGRLPTKTLWPTSTGEAVELADITETGENSRGSNKFKRTTYAGDEFDPKNNG